MSLTKLKVKRVLFFDSGVGGLSVLRAVERINPDIESYYLFDNECFPYGTKSDDFLINRVEYLVEKAAKKFDLSAIVVACNTASTVALPTLRLNLDIPIVGVVPAIKPAALISKNKVVGLLATPGTLRREYTNQLIKDFASDCEIIKVGSPQLAVMAENRLCTGIVEKEKLSKIVAPFNEAKIKPDTVVLGCTHYPFLKDVLQELLPNTKLIDSGEAIGRRVKTVIEDSRSMKVIQKEKKIFYTGDLLNFEERMQLIKKFGFTKLQSFDE